MSIRRITETIIPDRNGKLTPVRAGDKVDLLPTHPDLEEGEDGKYLSHNNHRHIIRFLEEKGPYKISWIGIWPCGGVNLYLDLPNGREPGVPSYDFRKN